MTSGQRRASIVWPPVLVLADVAAMQRHHQLRVHRPRQRQRQRSAAGELRMHDRHERGEVQRRRHTEMPKQQAAHAAHADQRRADPIRARQHHAPDPDRPQRAKAEILAAQRIRSPTRRRSGRGRPGPGVCRQGPIARRGCSWRTITAIRTLRDNRRPECRSMPGAPCGSAA